MEFYKEDTFDGVLDGYIYITEEDVKKVIDDDPEYASTYEWDIEDVNVMIISRLFETLTETEMDYNYCLEYDREDDEDWYFIGELTDKEGNTHSWKLDNSEEEVGVEFELCEA